ncbi:hypothetical protein [Actinoplanes sp. NPDC051859]|uniref:hypothetical protein n=1 Tax=Actinoplanes sp. NPDC051859 TaxID=3363909 RepID=UPI00378EE463
MYDEPSILLFANCIRCTAPVVHDPATVPSIWIDTITRCPLRTDGTPITPGAPGTVKEPLCGACASLIRKLNGRPVPVTQLMPGAHHDLIRPRRSHDGDPPPAPSTAD